MKKTKVLFINPPYISQGGIEGQGGKSAPLNLAYLAAFLRKNNKNTEVKIVDAEGLKLTLKQIHHEVDIFSPHIIGITCPTPVYHTVKIICRDIKKRDKYTRIVLGGPHPTALPEKTLQDIDCDAVVIGEGENTFSELVDALSNNISKLASVFGIAYRVNSEIKINKPRELIENLDSLPFPAKDLLPLNKYYLPPTKAMKSERATNMITSRGCPFSCNFCMATIMWGNRTRFRSVENIIEEIKINVQGYKLTEFSFHDEFFTLKKDRLLKICKGIIDNGLDIAWACQTRAGSLDPEMLKIMKKSGCGKIAFGFESGSERILKLMNKRENLKNAIESVKLCKDVGMDTVGAFILGYPGEDTESIEKTIEFAIKLDCEAVSFFIAIPFPGTRLYFEAIEKGYLDQNPDWEEFAPISKFDSPMRIPNFTPAELTRWKKIAYRRYYLRPKYIFKKLRTIRSKGDMKNILRGAKLFKDIFQ